MAILDDRAMLGRVEPGLRAVAVAIWAFLGFARPLHGLWVPVWCVYGVALCVGGMRTRLPVYLRVGCLLVQTAAALVLPLLGFKGFEGLLLAIVAAQVPTVLSLRSSIAWAVGQIPPLVLVVIHDKTPHEIAEIVGAYSSFVAFALLVVGLHLEERRVKGELSQANAALLATRALVIEGSRHGERLRIAHELHDSLGHHLAALNVQLEVATRFAQGAALDSIKAARTTARDSFGELRRVVTAMHDAPPVDLVAALEAMAAGIPSPRIRICAQANVRATDAESSHALFRCIQEAITNSVKHARAREVRVDIARSGEAIDVRVRDDGEGTRELRAGHGLRGIEDRVKNLGGRVDYRSSAGAGFELRLSVPCKVGLS